MFLGKIGSFSICPRSSWGVEGFNEMSSIDSTWNFSGWLLSMKGYPRHYQPTITIDTNRQHAVLRSLGGAPDEKFIFTPERTWIERIDSSIKMDRTSPTLPSQAMFALHPRMISISHISSATHFGTTSRPPFASLAREHGQIWRVLEVTYPDGCATHTKVQKFYFDEEFMLQREDCVTDVAGGVVVHYCLDPKEVGGIVFPMLTRVLRRDPESDDQCQVR
ncbi:uncharacterized protein PAC_00138 [Phialocephala subalpina]|uniref:Uncharacterized protein n=1 Tax=Phialocephala subalpina TaxID=576137 RepID=A0A1L7WBW2_9HELO|nr:uncharacterized protein PAC_00138 [Phialocephala subalpina]